MHKLLLLIRDVFINLMTTYSSIGRIVVYKGVLLWIKLIFNEYGDRGTQSMIGGNTTNLREWNRIKYDWANQMYRTMLNNFWIPEEISLERRR